MSIFDLFKSTDINEAVKTAQETKNSVLVDVRTEEEYREGHIPGSVNIPSQHLQNIEKQIADKTTPLFLYCRTGARSSKATAVLKSAGYQNATDIGGIMQWRGNIEKGAKE